MMTITHVDKFYKGRQVLADINFEIDRGEVLGLVGESGCGKSTLARLLGGYEKPDGGAVLFEGQEVARLRGRALKSFRQHCQMVFQDNLASLNPSMKLLASLREPLNNNFDLSQTAADHQIRELMAEVSLRENILPKLPVAVSGGERQRANICRALLAGPKLMICDEITSSLDVITQKRLLKLLKHLNAQGLTILFISHDIDAVKSISHRVMVMGRGSIVETLHREDGFKGTNPYTQKLFEALPIRHPSQRAALAV